jgi:hypothetical protein
MDGWRSNYCGSRDSGGGRTRGAAEHPQLCRGVHHQQQLCFGPIPLPHLYMYRKAHGLVARTEAHYLGPALAHPGPLPMGPCRPGMKGCAVPRNQPVWLARHSPFLTASPLRLVTPTAIYTPKSQPSRRLPETLTHSPCPPP